MKTVKMITHFLAQVPENVWSRKRFEDPVNLSTVPCCGQKKIGLARIFYYFFFNNLSKPPNCHIYYILIDQCILFNVLFFFFFRKSRISKKLTVSGS